MTTFWFSSAIVLVQKWVQAHLNLIGLTISWMEFKLVVHLDKLKVVEGCHNGSFAGNVSKQSVDGQNHSPTISFSNAFIKHLGLL